MNKKKYKTSQKSSFESAKEKLKYFYNELK